MKKNADGSLTLYTQKDSPGTATESSWLPVPNGPVYHTVRLNIHTLYSWVWLDLSQEPMVLSLPARKR